MGDNSGLENPSVEGFGGAGTRNKFQKLMQKRSVKHLKTIAQGSVFAILVGGFPLYATEVNPKIHKLCIEAKAYAGCVGAMNGDTSSETVRTINSQGADIVEGNQCTTGYAYIGGGNCQNFYCVYPSTDLGHDRLVAGRKDKRGKDVWGCKYNWLRGAGELRLTGAVTRTTINPKCPDGEPKLGYNNTCQTECTKKSLEPLGDESGPLVNDDLRYDSNSSTQSENSDLEQ